MSDDAISCEQCALKFTRKANLRRHIAQVHDGEKKYVCDVESCAKKFKRNEDLVLHTAAAHTVTSHPCSMKRCRERFASQALLTEHLSAAHGTQPTVGVTSKENGVAVLSVPPPAPIVRAATTSATSRSAPKRRATSREVQNRRNKVTDDDDDTGDDDTGDAKPRKTEAVDGDENDHNGNGADYDDDDEFNPSRSAKKSKRGAAAGKSSSSSSSRPTTASRGKPHAAAATTDAVFSSQQVLISAKTSRLIIHGDHVDAVVDGRLVGFQRGVPGLVPVEHDVASALQAHAQHSAHASPVHHCASVTADTAPTRNGTPPITSTSSAAAAAAGDGAHGCVDAHAACAAENVHGAECEHVRLPHDDHDDYLVGNQLHCRNARESDADVHARLMHTVADDMGLMLASASAHDWLELFATDVKRE